jgi:hypothetical protein
MDSRTQPSNQAALEIKAACRGALQKEEQPENPEKPNTGTELLVVK